MQLAQYLPDVDEPSDFDAFWRSTLDEAKPSVIDVRPFDNDLATVDCWDVTFAGFGGDPIRAWFSRPSGVDTALPAVVEYVGYGRGRGLPIERLTWVAAGYAHLLMDVRGQGDQFGNGGDTPDPQPGTPGGHRPTTMGILSPETYYYRRLITDAVRAVDAVRALPGVDPARVVAAGNSQGGGLALAVAGLVPDLAALLTTAPFLCDMRRAIETAQFGAYTEIATYLGVNRGAYEQVCHTLSYVDGVSFARRANAPAHFGVGLRDTTCPPSTAYAAYNHYRGVDRVIHAYPFNNHEGGEALHTQRQLAWLRPRLYADQ